MDRILALLAIQTSYFAGNARFGLLSRADKSMVCLFTSDGDGERTVCVNHVHFVKKMDMVDTNRSTAAKQEIEMRQEIEQAWNSSTMQQNKKSSNDC